MSGSSGGQVIRHSDQLNLHVLEIRVKYSGPSVDLSGSPEKAGTNRFIPE